MHHGSPQMTRTPQQEYYRWDRHYYGHHRWQELLSKSSAGEIDMLHGHHRWQELLSKSSAGETDMLHGHHRWQELLCKSSAGETDMFHGHHRWQELLCKSSAGETYICIYASWSPQMTRTPLQEYHRTDTDAPQVSDDMQVSYMGE